MESEAIRSPRKFLNAVNSRVKKKGWMILSLIPILIAIYSSCRPAIIAVSASYNLPDFSSVSSLNYLDTKRKVQKHYLDYGIYIPIDDIIMNQDENNETTHLSLLEQACGKGIMYIWVPLRFRIPVLGEKVLEWCLLKQ